MILNFLPLELLHKNLYCFSSTSGLVLWKREQNLDRSSLEMISKSPWATPPPISRFQDTAQKSQLCPSAALPYPWYLPSGILFSLVTLLLIHKMKCDLGYHLTGIQGVVRASGEGSAPSHCTQPSWENASCSITDS